MTSEKAEDLSGWLTKEEVAARLSASEKTVERYVKKGDLERKTRRVPGRRPLPVFNPDDVERIEAETIERTPAGALARSDNHGGQLEAVEAFGAMVRAAVADKPAKVRLDRKVTLTIPEAAELSGLGRGVIERAIGEGRIVAHPFGPHGARVLRREDVEWLVGELFAAPKARKGAKGAG